MKQKLLEALKTKFKDLGVQDSILEGVAAKLSKTITTEDQIETAISGVTFDTLLQPEVDRRATEASDTAVKNYEKKHKLKDGKAIEDPTKKKPDPKPKEGEGDDEKVPAWATAFMEKQDALDERISKQEKDRETSSKQTQVDALLKDSKIDPEDHDLYRAHIDLESETSLEDQVKKQEERYLEREQKRVNNSVDEDGERKGGEATDSDMDEYLDDKFPEGAEEKK